MLALGGDLFVAGEEQESSSKVQSMLRETRGSISYLALSYRDPALLTLGYDKAAPTTDNIASDRYPLWSYEHLYTRGAPSGETVEFLTFLTSGRFQREVFPGLGFIPLHDMRVVRDEKG
jgi:phosphate transport system substrate-binding protein